MAIRNLGHENSLFRVISLVFFMLKFWFFRFDEVVIVKSSNEWLVKWLRKRSKKLIFDIDDAVWGKSLWGELKCQKLFSYVDEFVCDNLYLNTVLSEVFMRPSSVLLGSLPICENPVLLKNHDVYYERCIVGWIGSESTSYNLYKVADYLLEIDRDDRFQLVFLGASNDVINNLGLKNHFIQSNYNEDILCFYLKNVINIGIFPMFNVENNWGRGYHKLRLYLNSKIPSLISPIDYVDEDVEYNELAYFIHEKNWFSNSVKIYEGMCLHSSDEQL